jgi:hypothetical protein
MSQGVAREMSPKNGIVANCRIVDPACSFSPDILRDHINRNIWLKGWHN